MVEDQAQRRELNDILSGGVLTDAEKPPMMTEAAKAIQPPSWWRGGTTISDANMVVENLRKGGKR